MWEAKARNDWAACFDVLARNRLSFEKPVADRSLRVRRAGRPHSDGHPTDGSRRSVQPCLLTARSANALSVSTRKRTAFGLCAYAVALISTTA